MSFIRKKKVGNRTYLVEVENVRIDGKVHQKFIRYIGKSVSSRTIRRSNVDDIRVESVKHSVDVQAITTLMEDLGLHMFENKIALAMVYSQILENRSIRKLEEWFKQTEVPQVLDSTITTKDMYTALTKFNYDSFVLIEEQIFSYFQNVIDDKTAAIIDVTDTYFEGKGDGEKRRRGKDSKVRHLLQIGLAVSLRNGFPLFHQTYQGNISNIQIMRDMISKVHERKIKAVILDRGMLSKENLSVLLGLSIQVIAGLKKSIQIVSGYLQKIQREEIYSLKNRVQLINSTVFIKSFDTGKGRVIAVYNPDLEVVKKNINFEKGIDVNDPYIGYSIIFHNTCLADEEVVQKYFEKDIVERAFKQLKGVLKIRPIRVWLKDHVEGHVRICYLAYAILALMQYRVKHLKMSASRALELLKPGYKVRLEDKKSKYQWDLLVDLQPQQRKIIDAIGVVPKN